MEDKKVENVAEEVKTEQQIAATESTTDQSVKQAEPEKKDHPIWNKVKSGIGKIGRGAALVGGVGIGLFAAYKCGKSAGKAEILEDAIKASDPNNQAQPQLAITDSAEIVETPVTTESDITIEEF